MFGILGGHAVQAARRMPDGWRGDPAVTAWLAPINLLSTGDFERLYTIPCTPRAFARVQARYPEATLTVIGDGSQSNVRTGWLRVYQAAARTTSRRAAVTAEAA
jgi:hypothetical protein